MCESLDTEIATSRVEKITVSVLQVIFLQFITQQLHFSHWICAELLYFPAISVQAD